MPRPTYPVAELCANLHTSLRALHVAQERGWCQWGGQVPAPGATRLPTHHLVQLNDGTNGWDVLDPVETTWELLGFADDLGSGDAIQRVMAAKPPAIIPLAEVADMWGLSLQRIGDIVELDDWWRLYVPATTPRHAYEAEAAYRLTKWARETGRLETAEELAGAAERQREWRAVAKTLPLRPVEPVPAPDGYHPVNIREDLNAFGRRVMALRIGEARGWYGSIQSTPDGQHEVEVSGNTRVLTAAGTLPWLRGVAARHGERQLITYREGL